MSLFPLLIVALLLTTAAHAQVADVILGFRPGDRVAMDEVTSRDGIPTSEAAFFIDRTPVRPASLSGYGPVRRDAVYLELVGQSLGITVNFEHKLFDTQPHNLSLRAGIGGFLFWLSVPVSVSYLLGYDHMLEVGTGWLYVSGEMWDKFISRYASGFMGYRYENGRGGFLFRAGITPLYLFSATGGGDNEFIIAAGISVGYAFL